MNWFSENKFLTGFGAVMLAGLGTLGYFTFSAMDNYETAVSEFDAAANNLKTLQSSKQALTDANLKDLIGQKQELHTKIASFQKELKGRVLGEEPVSMIEFQNRLKEAVATFNTKAAAAKVVPPKDFYMGFGEYQAKPPEAKAAPALARQLRAIVLVMNALIDAKDVELGELHRDTLPEETGKAKPASPPPPPGGKPSPNNKPDRKLVEKTGLRIKITSSDLTLQKIIAGLANHKEQLFIIRKISVHNTQPESPPRLAVGSIAPSSPASPDGASPSPSTPDAGAAPGGGNATAPSGGSLTYVFGKEKITSVIDLEVLNIAEPEVKQP